MRPCSCSPLPCAQRAVLHLRGAPVSRGPRHAARFGIVCNTFYVAQEERSYLGPLMNLLACSGSLCAKQLMGRTRLHQRCCSQPPGRRGRKLDTPRVRTGGPHLRLSFSEAIEGGCAPGERPRAGRAFDPRTKGAALSVDASIALRSPAACPGRLRKRGDCGFIASRCLVDQG